MSRTEFHFMSGASWPNNDNDRRHTFVEIPNTTKGTITGRTEHRSSTMLRDPHAGLYLVRQTTYGAYRVYNVKTQDWEGNAFEEESEARALARKLNREHHD